MSDLISVAEHLRALKSLQERLDAKYKKNNRDDAILLAEVKHLRKRVRELSEGRMSTVLSAHRREINTLLRRRDKLFMENRELRGKLKRSIDPAYIVAVCKAIGVKDE